MLKIRRPLGRLIFNMGIAIPGKTVFLIETAPWTTNGTTQKTRYMNLSWLMTVFFFPQFPAFLLRHFTAINTYIYVITKSGEGQARILRVVSIDGNPQQLYYVRKNADQPFRCWNQNIPGELARYPGCWWKFSQTKTFQFRLRQVTTICSHRKHIYEDFMRMILG